LLMYIKYRIKFVITYTVSLCAWKVEQFWFHVKVISLNIKCSTIFVHYLLLVCTPPGICLLTWIPWNCLEGPGKLLSVWSFSPKAD
jgi:hypothetical protein